MKCRICHQEYTLEVQDLPSELQGLCPSCIMTALAGSDDDEDEDDEYDLELPPELEQDINQAEPQNQDAVGLNQSLKSANQAISELCQDFINESNHLLDSLEYGSLTYEELATRLDEINQSFIQVQKANASMLEGLMTVLEKADDPCRTQLTSMLTAESLKQTLNTIGSDNCEMTEQDIDELEASLCYIGESKRKTGSVPKEKELQAFARYMGDLDQIIRDINQGFSFIKLYAKTGNYEQARHKTAEVGNTIRKIMDIQVKLYRLVL